MVATIEIVVGDPAVADRAARAFAGAPAGWSVELRDEASGGADVVVRDSAGGASGDVVFDPARPDEALREVEARLQTPGPRAGAVLVAGAVGGCGATTLGLHLAAAWGRGTCFADLSGGAAAKLGMPDDARTWLPGDEDVAASALPTPGAFRVLCAPRPCPLPAHFPTRAAVASFERVVLETGACHDVEALMGNVRAGVLVTTPTRPGAAAARTVLESWPGVRWAVVTNRVGPGGQIMRRGFERLLGRPVAIELPCCAALRDAEDEARLLTGRWHRWTRAVGRLAGALEAC